MSLHNENSKAPLSKSRSAYRERDLARADVFDDIEVFHDRTDRHTHLAGVSAETFEQASL